MPDVKSTLDSMAVQIGSLGEAAAALVRRMDDRAARAQVATNLARLDEEVRSDASAISAKKVGGKWHVKVHIGLGTKTVEVSDGAGWDEATAIRYVEQKIAKGDLDDLREV